MTRINVVLAQLTPELGNKEKNIKKVLETIEKYHKPGLPNLFLFPELFLTGYLVKEAIYDLAEEVRGESSKKIAQFLKDFPETYVAIGIPELSDTPRGIIYNSYVFISSKGVEAVFRKRHLPTFSVFDEYRYFKPGPISSPPLLKIRNFRVGAMICYDTFFPEVARTLALLGADLICVASAAPTLSRAFWKPLLRSRAIENTVYVAYVNTVGFQDGLDFFGESILIDPLGNIIAHAKSYEEDVLSIEIDLNMVYRARRIRPVQKDIGYEDILMLIDAYEFFLA